MIGVAVQKHLFNVADYHYLAKTRLFKEDDHIELIEGEIIDMAPIGPPHTSIVTRLTDLFYELYRKSAIVRVQNPIQLGDGSEPEPDIALLRLREDLYAVAHPTNKDVLLSVEVAETSLKYDRDVKVPLYAVHAIPEVWIVDVIKQRIEIYREPSDGIYQTKLTVKKGQTLTPTGLESPREIKVEQILGL